jgi:SAM-dependent methyltransferase
MARDLDWWQLAFADRYADFVEFLAGDSRRLLDIGSGPGFFLDFGARQGWQVKGIEPSRQAAAHARDLGLDIHEGFFTAELAAEMGSFDVVHMNNVLEHVPNPKEIISCSRQVLSEKGLLCVVVPNDYNPFQQALKEACDFKPWWVAAPHHVNYFDYQGLEGLLERCGFEICRRETTFPIDMFLLMGDNYVGNDEVGRACHGRRMELEKNLHKAGMNEVKRRLYRALASEGLGREIVLLARRTD